MRSGDSSLPARTPTLTERHLDRVEEVDGWGGSQTAESSAPGAMQQGTSSHSHCQEAVVADAPPQTSVASLS